MIRSLKSAVSRQHALWMSTNPWKNVFESTITESLIIWTQRNPVRASFWFLVVFITLSISIYWYQPPYLGLIDFGPRDVASESNPFSPDTLFTGLLAVQGALVALIYPVSLSFATVFLQKAHATKATLHSYLVTSGAKVTGTCGLAILLGLTLLSAVLSVVPLWVAFGWLILGTVAVSLNICLTVNFLMKTFSLATPEARQRTRNMFAVKFAWKDEWQRHTARAIANNPVQHGLINAEQLSYRNKNTGPAFTSIIHHATKQNKLASFKGRKLVYNVRYLFVQIAYNYWRKKEVIALGRLRPGSPQSAQTFFFGAEPGKIYQHGDVLLGLDGDTSIPWHMHILMWLAISYKDSSHYEKEITVKDCMDEIRAELAQSIASKSTEEFNVQLHSFIELMNDLLKISYFQDGEKKACNQVLTELAVSEGPPTSALSLWCSVITDTLKIALDLCSSNERFASLTITTPKNLSIKGKSASNKQINSVLLEQQFKCLDELIKWLGAEMTKLRIKESEARTELLEPVASNVRTVLYKVVGALETFDKNLIDDIRATEWDILNTHAELVQEYLSPLITNIFKAAATTSTSTGLVLLDSLLRWSSKLKEDDFIEILDSSWTLTTCTFNQPWVLVKKRFKVAQLSLTDPILKRCVAVAVFTNFWKDICSVLASSLAINVRNTSFGASNHHLRILKGLLVGGVESGVENSGAAQEAPFTGPTDFFKSVIRQYLIDGAFNQGYRSTMDKVAHDCNRHNIKYNIPGRTTGSVSQGELKKIQMGQLLCLYMLATDGWNPSIVDFKVVFDKGQSSYEGELTSLITIVQSFIELTNSAELTIYRNSVSNAEFRINWNTATTAVNEGLLSLHKELSGALQDYTCRGV